MKLLLKKLRRLSETSIIRWPEVAFGQITKPVPPGTWLLNFIVQRVLGVNRNVPWMVHFTSTVIGDVRVGRNVWRSFALSGGCYIQGINGIRIGDDTIFAPGVKLISANHDLSNFDMPEPAPELVIGRRCWLGANAVVLPGVVLGDDVIVGAGAVVTKCFPSNVVLAGVPARPIRIARSLVDEVGSSVSDIRLEGGASMAATNRHCG